MQTYWFFSVHPCKPLARNGPKFPAIGFRSELQLCLVTSYVIAGNLFLSIYRYRYIGICACVANLFWVIHCPQHMCSIWVYFICGLHLPLRLACWFLRSMQAMRSFSGRLVPHAWNDEALAALRKPISRLLPAFCCLANISPLSKTHGVPSFNCLRIGNGIHGLNWCRVLSEASSDNIGRKTSSSKLSPK